MGGEGGRWSARARAKQSKTLYPFGNHKEIGERGETGEEDDDDDGQIYQAPLLLPVLNIALGSIREQ